MLFKECELRFFSELAIIRTQCIDYAGVANMQHVQIAIFKFAIYLEKPEKQLFYYTIKTRPTVHHIFMQDTAYQIQIQLHNIIPAHGCLTYSGGVVSYPGAYIPILVIVIARSHPQYAFRPETLDKSRTHTCIL